MSEEDPLVTDMDIIVEERRAYASERGQQLVTKTLPSFSRFKTVQLAAIASDWESQFTDAQLSLVVFDHLEIRPGTHYEDVTNLVTGFGGGHVLRFIPKAPGVYDEPQTYDDPDESYDVNYRISTDLVPTILEYGLRTKAELYQWEVGVNEAIYDGTGPYDSLGPYDADYVVATSNIRMTCLIRVQLPVSNQGTYSMRLFAHGEKVAEKFFTNLPINKWLELEMEYFTKQSDLDLQVEFSQIDLDVAEPFDVDLFGIFQNPISWEVSNDGGSSWKYVRHGISDPDAYITINAPDPEFTPAVVANLDLWQEADDVVNGLVMEDHFDRPDDFFVGGPEFGGNKGSAHYNWRQGGGSLWGLADNQMYCVSNTNANTCSNYGDWGNIEITARLQSFYDGTNQKSMGLAFRGSSTAPLVAGYLFVDVSPTGQLRLREKDSGGTISTITSSVVSIVSGEFYVIRVRAVNSNIKVYINDLLIINFDLTGPAATNYNSTHRWFGFHLAVVGPGPLLNNYPKIDWVRLKTAGGLSSGDRVPYWPPHTGSNWRWRTGVDANAPRYIPAEANGRAVMRFSGAERMYAPTNGSTEDLSYLFSDNEHTVFVVARMTASNPLNTQSILAQTLDDSQRGYRLRYKDSGIDDGLDLLISKGVATDPIIDGTSSANAMDPGSFRVIEELYGHHSGADSEIYVDGDLVFSQESANLPNADPPMDLGQYTFMGSNADESGQFLNADIAAVLMFSRLLENWERDLVRTYLTEKFIADEAGDEDVTIIGNNQLRLRATALRPDVGISSFLIVPWYRDSPSHPRAPIDYQNLPGLNETDDRRDPHHKPMFQVWHRPWPYRYSLEQTGRVPLTGLGLDLRVLVARAIGEELPSNAIIDTAGNPIADSMGSWITDPS